MALQLPTSNGIATFHWRYSPLAQAISVTTGYFDTLATNDANAHATAFNTQMTTTGSPAAVAAMTVDWQFTGVTTQLKTTTGFLVIGANTTVTTGTATTTSAFVPLYTPLVVTKRTAFAGRAFRGRFYPPFTLVTEANVDPGGNITGAVLTSLGAQWNAFKALNDASNVPMRLLHTDHGVGTPTPNAIASLLVRPVTGIQRRRRSPGA